MNKPLPAIAQTLINLELVSRNDIEEIIVEHKEPKDIVAQINDRGILTSYELSKQFSDRFGSPLFDMDAFDISQIPLDLVDMKLVERHVALPLFRRGKNLFVAMFDPTNKSAVDEIKFYTGLQVLPIQTEVTALSNAISRIQEAQQDTLEDFLGEGDLDLELGEESDDRPKDDLDFDPNEAPIVKYVNKVLVDAINRGASDIHVEPFERELRIRFRIDGILHKITTQPISIAPRIVARIKIISKLDIAERRIPQDGRVKLKVSRTKAYDFRVNTLPTVWGEKVVMRILDSSAANLDLNILGFTPEQLALYEKIVKRPYGMVLITGPTGSGKTVTLYSALHMLNDPTKNISTVEDPVEIQLSGITQVNINEKANMGFADALRAFLRQDPDILMLGEIRDLETAEIAIKAAQTGHMVLSTLHTNDAPATLTRLLNMGVPAFNVASAVQLIVAQRLVRKLCQGCRVEAELPDKVLLDAGFGEEEIGTFTPYGPNLKGCPACTEGYKGRAGVFQVMPVSEHIKTIIMEGCTEKDIELAAKAEGTIDLRRSGLEKVKAGLTSLEEIERVTNA